MKIENNEKTYVNLWQKTCFLVLILIFSQLTHADEMQWTVIHFGECNRQELAQGFKTGVRWHNGGHAGPELREVCLRAKINHLKNFNRTNNSQAFITSGTASVAWPEAQKYAIEQMWRNAQKICEYKKVVRISEIITFDVGTFIAARASFMCVQN